MPEIGLTLALGLIILTELFIVGLVITLIIDIRFLLNAKLKPLSPELITLDRSLVKDLDNYLIGFSKERNELKDTR